MDAQRSIPELSFLGRRWKLQEPEPADALASLPYTDATKALLIARGLKTPDQVERFLNAGLEHLADPLALPGVEAAARRILQAIERGELIGVYGDYDVDGQSAAALVLRVLHELGARTVAYIPHRVAEGYGLHVEALARLMEKGCTLVVTVDCGIAAAKEAAWARQHGLDLVVTDHHEPPAHLPEAVAVVNPKLAPCALERDEHHLEALAGCGVAFKVAEALGILAGRGRQLAHRYTDLVALGTVADVVPLIGENRALVRDGLRRINRGDALPGIRALCAVAGVTAAVRAGHIAFSLAPRLNAVGRIGDANLGLRLLMEERYSEALLIAERLDRENAQRQAMEAQVVAEARAQVEAQGLAGERSLVVWKEGWHVGVVGIAASRLVELYYRPTVVLSVEGDRARGSGRSIPGFDLYEALAACSDLFEAFGGHAQAAGVTLPLENVAAFRERFAAIARARLSESDLVPTLTVDGAVRAEEITLAWADELARLEPFGVGNPAPVFVCSEVRLEASAVGRDREHLKCTLRAGERPSGVDGIGFGLAAALLPRLEEGRFFDVAFTPEVNEWNGERRVSLRLRDVRLAQSEASPAALLVKAAVGVDADGGPGAPPPAAGGAKLGRRPRVVDRRGAAKAELLVELVEAGRSAVILTADGRRLGQKARALADLHPALKRSLFPWSPALDARFPEAVGRALKTSPWLALICEPVATGHPAWEEALLSAGPPAWLVLWDLPADPRPFWAQVALWEQHEAPPTVVLAFGEEDVARFQRQVALDFPGRQQLEWVYRALRELSKQGPVPFAALVEAAARHRPPFISSRGLARAVAIFMELGLVADSGGRLRLRPVQGKVDLTSSLRYNECNHIRTGPLASAKDLLYLDPYELLDQMAVGARVLGEATAGRSAS